MKKELQLADGRKGLKEGYVLAFEDGHDAAGGKNSKK